MRQTNKNADVDYSLGWKAFSRRYGKIKPGFTVDGFGEKVRCGKYYAVPRGLAKRWCAAHSRISPPFPVSADVPRCKEKTK
ncbi:MAG: hypothetical protein IKY61_06055 [Thermoguttaceae bacterium]|nr:hypothetical protein [Thermoguttaceae bacterium]